MVSGIGSQAADLQQLQGMHKKHSPEEMFKKLSEDLGSDGTTITKDQLTSYMDKLKSSDSPEDKKKLGFLQKLSDNFDKIAGVDGEISETDLKNNIDLLKPPERKSNSMANTLSSLSLNTQWQDPSEITKDQLESPINLLV